MKPGKIRIGIDLGTTNSVVAVELPDGLKVIPIGDKTSIPSVVHVNKEGVLDMVGEEAVKKRSSDPENTFWSVKRLIGRKVAEIQDEIGRFPFRNKIKADAQGYAVIDLGDGRQIPVERISAEILKKLKGRAEEFLRAQKSLAEDEDIVSVRITCPTYFDFAQRAATRMAGEMAGFTDIGLIDEPSAAAVAYGKRGKVVVFDWGGGTFDLSVLHITGEGDQYHYLVKAIRGDTHLGGDDLDDCMAKYLAFRVTGLTGGKAIGQESFDALPGVTQTRLRRIAREVKEKLTQADSWEIKEDCICIVPKSGTQAAVLKDLQVKITRKEFEELIAGFLNRIRQLTQEVPASVKMSVEEIDYCILVGGSVRVPAAESVARSIFGNKVKTDLDARSVVALGAASRAIVAPVLPMDFGVALHDGGFHRILKAGTPYPCSAQGEYVPSEDYACEFEIALREGLSSLARDNRAIETIKVDIVKPGKKEERRILILYRVDEYGCLYCEIRIRQGQMKVMGEGWAYATEGEENVWRKQLGRRTDTSSVSPCDSELEQLRREFQEERDKLDKRIAALEKYCALDGIDKVHLQEVMAKAVNMYGKVKGCDIGSWDKRHLKKTAFECKEAVAECENAMASASNSERKLK